MNLDIKNREILELLSTGLTRKEIAGKVFLSKNSIDKRLQKLMIETGSKNGAELACWFKELRKSVTTSSNNQE